MFPPLLVFVFYLLCVSRILVASFVSFTRTHARTHTHTHTHTHTGTTPAPRPSGPSEMMIFGLKDQIS
jgi:hypothetical protein